MTWCATIPAHKSFINYAQIMSPTYTTTTIRFGLPGCNKLEFRVEGDSTIRLLTTFKENIRVSSPICCTDDGYIYIGMNKGLLRIDRAQPERQHSLLPDIKVQSLYQDSQKNLWICTSRRECIGWLPTVLSSTSATFPIIPTHYRTTMCAVLSKMNLGNLWFGTFYGLNKYNPSTQVWENHDFIKIIYLIV